MTQPPRSDAGNVLRRLLAVVFVFVAISILTPIVMLFAALAR